MNFIERSINSSRLFLHLSISEGFGIVLLEAVAAEVPVIANETYPVNHIAKKRETVPMVGVSDREAYVAAIIELITNKQFLCNMGRADFKRWIEEFSKEKMFRLTDNLYRGLNESLSANASWRMG